MGTDGGYVVYILSSGIGGTLYIGVTSNLVRRVYEHKTKAADAFTKKYDVDRLVYYEHFEDVEEAIRREKRLKRYNRGWKISLIEPDRGREPKLGGPLSFNFKSLRILGPPVKPEDDIMRGQRMTRMMSERDFF